MGGGGGGGGEEEKKEEEEEEERSLTAAHGNIEITDGDSSIRYSRYSNLPPPPPPTYPPPSWDLGHHQYLSRDNSALNKLNETNRKKKKEKEEEAKSEHRLNETTEERVTTVSRQEALCLSCLPWPNAH